MAGYYLSEEAHTDLVGIALYTAERWGNSQEEIYIGRLYANCQLALVRAWAPSVVKSTPGMSTPVRTLWVVGFAHRPQNPSSAL